MTKTIIGLFFEIKYTVCLNFDCSKSKIINLSDNDNILRPGLVDMTSM